MNNCPRFSMNKRQARNGLWVLRWMRWVVMLSRAENSAKPVTLVSVVCQRDITLVNYAAVAILLCNTSFTVCGYHRLAP